jgi:hypothetical protein
MLKLSLFLIRFFKKRPLIVLSVILLLSVFSLSMIYHTGFGKNFLQYIPQEAVRTHAYLEALNHLGGEESCYIILRGHIPTILAKAEKISEELRQLKEIADVKYRVTDELKNYYLTLLKKRLPLYLSDESIDEFFHRISPSGMEEAIRRTQLRLMMPGGGEIGRIDPLGFTDFIKPFPEGERFLDANSGYYLLKEKNGLVLIASVTGEPRDLFFDHNLVTGIEAVLEKNLNGKDNITFTITGSHAITYYEATQMKRELQRNILISLIFVSIVLLIFFRKDVRIMLYAFLPVAISIIFALGLVSLLIGNLTEASVGFGGMLIGLGVDLPIMLYVKHLFLKNIEKSIEQTSAGIWTGALTTWATFSPMLLSRFTGIQEIGLLTSSGIIICACILFGFVAGLMGLKTSAALPYHFSSFSKVLFSRSMKRLFPVLVFVLIPLSLWIIKDIKFDIDLRELGSEKNAARTALSEIIKENKKVFLIGNAETPDEAIKKANAVERRLHTSGMSDVISQTMFSPPLEKQLMVIDRLRNINKDEVVQSFALKAEQAGFSNQFIQQFSDTLKEMLSVNTPIKYEDTMHNDFLKDRFLWKDEKGFHYLIVVQNADAGDIPDISGVTVTDKESIKKELSDLIKTDAFRISLVGFLLVNLILFFSFRSIKSVVFIQLPILTGILFTGAILTATGRNIHIMSALTGIMLFGIGTDYAIHFVHHIRRENDIQKIVSQTGAAIIISALTTICGFGSLYFSSYRGLSDMGLAVSIGTALNLVLVFLFLPLYKSHHCCPK